LRDIEAALNDRDEAERVMVFTGIRGSGKTAILAEARERSGGEITVIDNADRDVPGLREYLIDYGLCAREENAPMLLMAGAPHAIEELLKDDELSYLRQARRVSLGHVREDEVYELYADAFAEAEGGASPDENALIRAAEATNGHPYLIQLIGYYLSKEGKNPDDRAVDKAIFLAKIEMYKNIHEPLVWGLSSKDRAFLWAMSQDESASEFGEIARRMGVSAGYASKYRERLINAGVIYSSAYGELAFSLPYMREYIEKEYIERLGGEGGKRRL